MKTQPVVGILMGSDSDLDVMMEAVKTLAEFGVPYEVEVASAHRSPHLVRRYVSSAERRGVKVFIVGAGGAAALPGVVAAETTLPVIGVPMPSSLSGLDSLCSIVQMPSGVPVATMAIGRAGALNAAILAVQILAAGGDARLHDKLKRFKKHLATKVAARSQEAKRRVAAEVKTVV
ncbi:MAG TPA: 5-(carboxyamino)imidazole ribonucleotide mutase [Blastocatellia bacterium]|nr:5-(carboxyamino)imidazole ribonucleotide mutase [Blastocatellia bacterium]